MEMKSAIVNDSHPSNVPPKSTKSTCIFKEGLVIDENAIVEFNCSIPTDANVIFVDQDGNQIHNLNDFQFKTSTNVNISDDTKNGSSQCAPKERESVKPPLPPNNSSPESNECDEITELENITKQSDAIKFPENVSTSAVASLYFLKSNADEQASAAKTITSVDSLHKSLPQPMELNLANKNDLSCPCCPKTFTKYCNKIRHIRKYHDSSVMALRKTQNLIRCVDCNLKFSKLPFLRNHLRLVHNMKMDTYELSFPNFNAFLQWKQEIERQELTKFISNRSSFKSKNGGESQCFVCRHSGRNKDPAPGQSKKRVGPRVGSCKLGIMCTAAIHYKRTPDEVQVSYCLQHYGHGTETTFLRLSEMEMSAIQENLSNGISCDSLLGPRQVDVTSDYLKKRDISIIKKALEIEGYNYGLSDYEGVCRWVEVWCQMEDSPILLYQQEEIDSSTELLLVIMTEFQKNILLSSDKLIVCVDSPLHRRRRPKSFYFMHLMLLDGSKVAFPVAFCISNKLNKQVMIQFLEAVRDSTGPLSCKYFMSDSSEFYYDAWREVMGNGSEWIWTLWEIDRRVMKRLQTLKALNMDRRAEICNTVRRLLECPNTVVFDTMYKNFINNLEKDPQARPVAEYISNHFGGKFQKYWAYSYHKDIKLSSIIQFEVFHRVLRYFHKYAREIRLDKFLLVMMKLLRFKMLTRLTSILDDEKVSLALDAINACHNTGLEVQTNRVVSLADKIWLVKSNEEEEDVYIVREFETCPDHCALMCSECNVCVHMFSCTCTESLINGNLCHHIHAVVWKFLTPHFSPLPSPAHDLKDEDMDVSSAPSDLYHTALMKAHNVLKTIQSNKYTMNESALQAIVSSLSDCMDICTGKRNPPSNASTQTSPQFQMYPQFQILGLCTL